MESVAVALSTSKDRPTATRPPFGQEVGFSRWPAPTWNICWRRSSSESFVPGSGSWRGGLGCRAPAAPRVARSRSGQGGSRRTRTEVAPRSSVESWKPPLESGPIMPQVGEAADPQSGADPDVTTRAGMIAHQVRTRCAPGLRAWLRLRLRRWQRRQTRRRPDAPADRAHLQARSIRRRHRHTPGSPITPSAPPAHGRRQRLRAGGHGHRPGLGLADQPARGPVDDGPARRRTARPALRWSLRPGSDGGIVTLAGEPAYETPAGGPRSKCSVSSRPSRGRRR